MSNASDQKRLSKYANNPGSRLVKGALGLIGTVAGQMGRPKPQQTQSAPQEAPRKK